MTRRVFLTLIAMALVIAACSVPRDNNARIITNPPLNTAVTVTTSSANAPRTQANVYFVRSSDKKLEAIATSVKLPASADERLEALIVDGPQERRLESKIPKGVTYQVVSSSVPHELIVILSNFRVDRLNRDALVLAFQQIVYTLTELAEVNSVQFSVNNAPYPVPLASGGNKPVGQGVRRIVDYEPETIYTTTTLPPTTLPPATTATEGTPSTAPGASAPTSGPTATGATATTR
ncbi:MAG TPA: GerMN domain-containing protein [Acidimicrobiales bacterium]|nr:GerMN domain-containing protein [Acidimicrobiales bacterium]